MRDNPGDWQPFRLDKPRYETIKGLSPVGQWIFFAVCMVTSVLVTAVFIMILSSCGTGNVRLTPASPQKVTPAVTSSAVTVTAHPRPVRTPPVITRKARPVNPTPSLPTIAP